MDLWIALLQKDIVEEKVGKSTHHQLAIHPVCYSAVPRNRLGKILCFSTFTLMFIERFNPDAKNPPNGAIKLANKAKPRVYSCRYVCRDWKYLKSITTVSNRKLLQDGWLNGRSCRSFCGHTSVGISAIILVSCIKKLLRSSRRRR